MTLSYFLLSLLKYYFRPPQGWGGSRPPQWDCHVLFLYLGIDSTGALLGGYMKIVNNSEYCMYPCLTLGVLFFKTDTLISGGIHLYASAGEVHAHYYSFNINLNCIMLRWKKLWGRPPPMHQKFFSVICNEYSGKVL